MGHVTGPTSSMPGSRHQVPPGTTCDDHPDRPAVARVQGETDSFGAEYIDLCQECVDQLKASQEEARSGRCDWCCQWATDLSNRRDLDEGMSGPVYRVCGSCRRKDNEAAAEELDYLSGMVTR